MMTFLRKKSWILLTTVLLAGLLCACGGTAEPTVTPVPEQIRESGVALPSMATPVPALPAPETSTPEPPIPETAEASAQETAPEPTAAPRPERVEDDWFADAAFFGNSILDGLHSCGGLQYGSFFAGTSASVLSVETVRDARLSDGTPATLMDALLEKQYGKIYVLLGINELGFNVGSFTELYAGMLASIAENEPDAEIFVMSLTPITERRNNSEDLFTKDKVLAFNAAIRAMAEEQGYTYLDIYPAFADENGWLPAEKSSDGVHFTAAAYLEMAEYLRTHYDGGPSA